MYGRIGDILRGGGRRRKTDAVNNRGSWVRRERVWLPECNPLPNTRLENRKDARFSGVLTGRGVSKSHHKIISSPAVANWLLK